MKLSREELLEEMGLGPVWHWRPHPLTEPQRAPRLTPPLAAKGEGASGPGPALLPREARASTATAAPALGLPAAPSAPSPKALASSLDPGAMAPPPAPAGDDARSQAIRAMDWEQLETAVRECTACGLCAKRRQAVPGVGDRQPDWMFIGEGPGAEEDERGEPFVGQAGRLLDNMLAAIGLRRGEKVYIANAVKCRPPNNRTPEAGEMGACMPFLERQIALAQPKLIVLMGRAAAHAVLGSDRALASLRGHRHQYNRQGLSIPVVVTYHPAYLLRNLPEKARAWEDLCFARRILAES